MFGRRCKGCSQCVAGAARLALAALRGADRSWQPAERPFIHAECCLVRARGACWLVTTTPTIAVTIAAALTIAAKVSVSVAIPVSTRVDCQEAATVTERWAAGFPGLSGAAARAGANISFQSARAVRTSRVFRPHQQHQPRIWYWHHNAQQY